MDVAIGFDTSCYTTSVAAVDAAGNVVAFQRKLLPVQTGQRGLRQSEAVFAHVRQMPALLEAAMREMPDAHICAVAASATPRAEPDSYMPVFTVGHGHARALAAALRVPCYSFTHQFGHIAAGQLNHSPMDDRFIALHLSGGTTELLLCEKETVTLLGGTLDLHAGQLVDRVGVALGLDFPAGPALEKLAVLPDAISDAALPVSLERGGLDCHLSGAETQCQRWISSRVKPAEQIAAEVFDVLARTVARMLCAAYEKTQAQQALLVGGVASSVLLREQVARRLNTLRCPIEVRFGEPKYSADNAAGIAWLGMKRWVAHTAADEPDSGTPQPNESFE